MINKFEGLESEPMFPEPPRRTFGRKRPVRSAGRSDCPSCGKPVNLYVLAVRNGRPVLAYRRHFKQVGNQAIFCRRSHTETEIEEQAR